VPDPVPHHRLLKAGLQPANKWSHDFLLNSTVDMGIDLAVANRKASDPRKGGFLPPSNALGQVGLVRTNEGLVEAT